MLDCAIFGMFILSMLAFSAFFSGSESAYFSLTALNKQKMSQNKRGTLVNRLLERPQRLLITILIGNTLVNVAIASLLDSYFENHFGRNGILLSIALSTFLLLVLGEITPKVVAIHVQEYFSQGTVYILNFIYRLLMPLVAVFYYVNTKILQLIGEKRKEEQENLISRDELKALLFFGKVEHSFRSQEKQIIKNLLLFGETTLSAVKVPRTQMVTVSDTQSLAEVLPLFTSSGYSRLPVYQTTPDNIVGLVYAKDLMPFALGVTLDTNMSSIIRPVTFVPEQQRAAKLFQDMLKTKQQLVITLDEFGAVSGLITMEDLIEEVIGEIYDEWDKTPAKIRPLSDRTTRVLADLEISEFDGYFGTELAQDQNSTSSTIGGYLLEQLGRLPHKDEHFNLDDLLIVFESVSKTKINSILVHAHSPGSTITGLLP
ncbi:HlyC/CorC family transporter [bacterium]|nr:HlyC/CorC family transporter [bacterium]